MSGDSLVKLACNIGFLAGRFAKILDDADGLENIDIELMNKALSESLKIIHGEDALSSIDLVGIQK